MRTDHIYSANVWSYHGSVRKGLILDGDCTVQILEYDLCTSVFSSSLDVRHTDLRRTLSNQKSSVFYFLTFACVRSCACVFFVQVDSVCIGIEHLMKRCKKNGDRTDQTLLPVTFPVNGENGPDDVVITHQQVCRLCESTRRVLRVARAHGSRPHDVHNCDACRMWSLVRARYNYLRRVEANNATATTTGSSRVLATSFSKV